MTQIEQVQFDIGSERYSALTAGQSGRPLLLFLHGFPEFSGIWRDVMADLADTYFCVAPDQRGYGASWRPADVSHYATRHLVADVAAMIRHFGNGHAAALIGHDWGASVAYATAFRHPEMIGRLVILNGVHPVPFQRALAAGGAQSEASQYIEWLREPGSETLLSANEFEKMLTLFGARMDMSWLTPDLAADYRAAWRDIEGLRGMVNWYRATPLKVARPGLPIPESDLPALDPKHLRVRMPHLLIWGMGDTALLPEAREGLEEFCEDLKVVEVPDADHWIIHQKPGLVAHQIRAFLKT